LGDEFPEGAEVAGVGFAERAEIGIALLLEDDDGGDS
jgi:hypothetical protein